MNNKPRAPSNDLTAPNKTQIAALDITQQLHAVKVTLLFVAMDGQCSPERKDNIINLLKWAIEKAEKQL